MHVSWKTIVDYFYYEVDFKWTRLMSWEGVLTYGILWDYTSNHAKNILFNFNSMNKSFYKERVTRRLFSKPRSINIVITQANQCRNEMLR